MFYRLIGGEKFFPRGPQSEGCPKIVDRSQSADARSPKFIDVVSPQTTAVRSQLAARACSSLREPLNEIYSPQSRQGSGTSAKYPLRCHSEMRRRCEAEDARYIPHIEAGIFRQLGRSYHSYKVDHSLQ